MARDPRVERDARLAQRLKEEKQLERLRDSGPEPLSPADIGAEIAKLTPEEFAYTLEHAMKQSGLSVRTLATLEAAYHAVCGPDDQSGPRRVELVDLIEKPPNLQDNALNVKMLRGMVPALKDCDDARILDVMVVRALRKIEPALAARDEREILDAWAQAVTSKHKHKEAQLSVALNMFGDRDGLPENAASRALNAAKAKARKRFDSTVRRLQHLRDRSRS